MFLCEISMTLCLVYKTTCSDQSSDMIWGTIKNKLSTCLWRWDSDIFTKTRMSCLNQTLQSKCSFTPFVLLTDSSVWTVSESEHASVYCIQCRQDSSSNCNLLLMWRTFSVIKCQPLSEWTPVGGAYGEMMTIHQCFALEAEFMQMFVPRWCHLAPQIQNETFLELD